MESGEVRYPVKRQLDYLNVWVGDHLCCHHQLVPVLLVGQHPSSKFNPCKKLVVMNLYLGGFKKNVLLAAKNGISSDDARLASSSSNADQGCLIAHSLV